jgi:L,D-transpeptidase ErfK/SrfK
MRRVGVARVRFAVDGAPALPLASMAMRAVRAAALIVASFAGSGVLHADSPSLSAVGRLYVSGESRARDVPTASRVSVELRLGERRLYLLETDAGGSARQVASYPVAIGREGYETPTGNFRVFEMIEDPDFVKFDWDDPSHLIRRIPPGPSNPLGKRWIGFASAPGWTIGFHGTPQPELLGRAVSHGCVRMRNRDVVELYRRVALGTPVVVRP